MAGMFYTLAQAAEVLGTTEEHVKELAAEGKVRTFQDGASLLYKMSEIKALKGKIEPQAAEMPVEEPEEELMDLEPVDLEDEPLELEPAEEDEASASELEQLLGLGAEDEADLAPIEMGDEPLDFEDEPMDLEPAEEEASELDDLLDLTPEEEETLEAPSAPEEPEPTTEPLDMEPSFTSDPSSEMDELMTFDPSEEEEPAEGEPVAADAGEFDELMELEPVGEDEIAEPEEAMELEPLAEEELELSTPEPEPVAADDEGLDEMMMLEPAEEEAIGAGDELMEAEPVADDDVDLDELMSLEPVSEEEPAAAEEGANLEDLLDLGQDEVGAVADDSIGLEESASPIDAYEDDDSVAGPMESGELELTDDTAEDIMLAPETGVNLDADLTNADTALSSAGINVLGESDADYDLTDDTLGETAAPGRTSPEASLEEIEDDVNLDTFGSGSGLLDLSLQADDTSLGGILDEIYTADDDAPAAMPAATAESTAEDMEAEADQIMADEEFAAPQAVAAAPAMMPMASAQIPYDDKANKVSSILMILTLPFIVYAALAAGLGIRGTAGRAVELTENYMMYVAGGVSLLLAIIGVTMFMGGGSGQPKAQKAQKTKAPKDKKKKEPKSKKEKKKKEPKPKKQKKK